MIGDEEVSRAIVEKFEKLGGASVSYAEIAKKAWEVGRTRLATMVSHAVSLISSLDTTQEDDVVVGPRAEGIRSSPLVAVNERRSTSAPESGRQWRHRSRYEATISEGRQRPLTSCLVYHVLLQLYNRLPLGAFFRLIEDGGSNLAPASRLLQVYAREQNPEMLRDFYYSDDRRVESAVLSLEESRQMKVKSTSFLHLSCTNQRPF